MKPRHIAIGCAFAAAAARAQAHQCKEVATVDPFDINAYASAKWYVHQQAETSYQPKSRNYCVTAEYRLFDRPTFFGYSVGVLNKDRDERGNEREAHLCAHVKDSNSPSKLAVAPCLLPTIAAGPYWVVAYDEAEGYALVSGGQPTNAGQNGGCTTGTGINNSGLWIFSRSQERDDALVTKVRGIAEGMGFDVSVLNDVDQSNCGGSKEMAPEMM